MELFDVYPLYDITPVRGAGPFVYDQQGVQFLDLYGGHAVISIGHAHPDYVSAIQEQIGKLGFYSNSVQNPLQLELAQKLEAVSGCSNYKLFLCNSGAEANENALKIASFHTGKKRILYFQGAFHGRTSGAVSVTDNQAIKAPFNKKHETTSLPFGAIEALEKELKKEDVAGVIVEIIQGVGGLNEASTNFYQKASALCKRYKALLIADEVQSGFGRTGEFFAFQKHGFRPDIISMAKGMGNGFPVGGILIDDSIEAKAGMLGSTFGGNHLACAAVIAVLQALEKEEMLKNAKKLFEYVSETASGISQVRKVKGRGLMLGFEFDFEVAALRKELLFKYKIFTGAASNPNLLRILPPLNIERAHFDKLFKALFSALNPLDAHPEEKVKPAQNE